MHDCTYTDEEDFEWGREKARSNLERHGIDFADAATALNDPLALTIEDDSANERRFVTLGVDALHRLLVVVHAPRGDRIRLISARCATPRERRRYEATP